MEYHDLIHFDAMTVTNGARIILPDRVAVNGLSLDSGRKILTEICKHPDIILSMETSDGFYASEDIPEWSPIVYRGFPELPTEGEIYKILVSSEHDSIFRAVEEAVYFGDDNDDIEVIRMCGTAVEITAENAKEHEYEGMPK